MNNLRLAEINNAKEALEKIGIQMLDNEGNFRPFNEVMMDLAIAIKHLRMLDEQEFENIRSYIYCSLMDKRYEIQFKF